MSACEITARRITTCAGQLAEIPLEATFRPAELMRD